MDKRKVLVIGREVSDFLCPLFRQVNEDGAFEVHLLETRKVSRKQSDIDASFAKQHRVNTSLREFGKGEWLKASFSGTFRRSVFRGKSTKDSLRDALVEKQLQPLFRHFDVFNIQFLTAEVVYLAGFIPEGKKIVLSFWGSDLFQCNEDFRHDHHQALIERANTVVVHSPEMKVIFLSKFGWHLEHKVKTFLMADMYQALQPVYEQLPSKAAAREKFRKKLGVEDSHMVITIGHSGHDIDDHEAIVGALANLPASIKEKCFFVLPMTYGAEPGYIDLVEDACRKAGLRFTILKEFLSQEDMVGLRFVADILVRLSRFDAFSLSLCETLCAGTVVISGAWLPYGMLRASGIYYREISEVEQVAAVLPEVIANLDSYRMRCQDNPGKVMQVFSQMRPATQLSNVFTS
jgi:hypothetical protein